MKKIALIITILSVFFSAFATVYAVSDRKKVDVVLSDTPAVVKVGETVELSATTEKHGSSYNDNWTNAVKSLTVFDPETGAYISKAVFSAVKPGDYTISYNINMSAGKSDTVFSGKIERTVKVISPLTVIGADIRNITTKSICKADGSISGYSACGTVYTLWSDYTVTPYGSIFFFFGPNETTKNINVVLYINSKQYTYTVTVKR